MRKIFLKYKWVTPIVLLMSVALTSCLKDNGVDDGEYQLVTGNNANEGGEFVSIPMAAKKPNTMGLESKAGFQTVNLFKASYDNVNAASTDITAVMERNDALVTALDPTYALIPASEVQVPSLNIVIPAGKRVSDDFLKIELNTGSLDPNKKYGIGFTLKSVSKAGAAIPENLKNVIFVFSIKNKYDGIYRVKVRMDLAADRDPAWLKNFSYNSDIYLVTTGPNSVSWVNTAFAGGVGYHPLMTPGVSGFGQTLVGHEFDLASNLMTKTTNLFPNPTNGRAFVMNPAVTDSRYDPATKTIYAAFIMSQTGLLPLPIYDTLTYVKARP